MGQNTKIIEFFGLPACGKSTLVTQLKKDFTDKGKTVTEIAQMQKLYRNAPLSQKITAFSVKKCFRYLSAFSCLKRYGSWKWYLKNCKFCIDTSQQYRWAMKYAESDYMLIDHGIIQNIVSLQNGHMMTEKYKKAVICALSAEKELWAVTECRVAITTAMERIRKRDRNVGRLDSVRHDDEKLVSMYEKEKKVFDNVKQAIAVSALQKILFSVDTNKTEEEMVLSVAEMFRRKEQ